MKIFKFEILIFILIIFITACQPDIRFLVPQPIDKNDLKTFPKIFQGKYISIADSSILTIDSKKIIQEWNGFAIVSGVEMKKELDTIYKSDTKIQEGNMTMTVKIYGDSAKIKMNILDTLFVISDKSILRTFKGYLFLNYKKVDSTWSVKTLKLYHKKLDFANLIDQNQIDTLKTVTNIITNIDTSSKQVDHYDLNPKRKELKEILKRRQIDYGFIKIK
jgi:hypothetical protein